jgi:ABC-2 type transport system permease protein
MSFQPQAEWRAIRVTFRKNLEGAMEIRKGFLIQVVGMMINNCAFLIGWIFFFHVFGRINGWSIPETIGLQGIIAFVFGIGFTIGDGALSLPDYVHQGVFDQFLLSPRNLYLRILTSKLRVSAIGDIFFGLILMIVYAVYAQLGLSQLVLLVLFLPPAILLFFNVSLMTSLVAFALPDSSIISRNLFEVFFSPSMYPASLYQGWIRGVFFFVIPSLAIGGIPIEAVRDHQWSLLLVIWVLSLAWMFLTKFALKKAIKKYESGNLTGARVM